MEKFLTITTLRDYILQYFPETIWWDGFHKHEVWNKDRSFKHKRYLERFNALFEKGTIQLGRKKYAFN